MTLDSLISSPALAWFALAAVLAIVELLLPGIFLVFLAAGAALTALVALIFPGLSFTAEILLFAVASSVAVAVGRRVYRGVDVPSADPLLNDRVARLIGQVVTVVEAIESGRGRVKVGDGEWNATGPDTPKGAHVRIIGSQGTLLDVEPVPN